MLVFVLNNRGIPLMPTTPARARHLLDQGKAEVVMRTPFTIQLLYGSSGYKQDITLGIKPGYSATGYSAVTSDKELIAGEIELRSDIRRLIEKRASYRRNRRSRKWYRQPRFNNRGIKKGWLPPSLRHKLDSHIRLVDRLKKILPITRIIVEVAKFDQQRMQNPEISGIEYQQGELQGYEVREYLLEKWGRKCAYCGKKDVPLEIEHITPKSRGGSDRVSNLTISCHECNQAKGNQTAGEFGHPRIQAKAKRSLKATAFMNVIRKRLVDLLNGDQTLGYVTKHNRIKLGLDKSHANDAYVIAGGDGQMQSGHIIIGKQVRRQNRSLYKANLLNGGRLRRNTVKQVNNFKRYDKVLYEEKECFIYGLRSSGQFDIRTIYGDRIRASITSKKLTLLERARGIMQEVRSIPLRAEAQSPLAQV